MKFRTLHGELYTGYQIEHSVHLSVPEVLLQLHKHLVAQGIAWGYIASLVSMSDPCDDSQFVTTLIVGS